MHMHPLVARPDCVEQLKRTFPIEDLVVPLHHEHDRAGDVRRVCSVPLSKTTANTAGTSEPATSKDRRADALLCGDERQSKDRAHRQAPIGDGPRIEYACGQQLVQPNHPTGIPAVEPIGSLPELEKLWLRWPIPRVNDRSAFAVIDCIDRAHCHPVMPDKSSSEREVERIALLALAPMTDQDQG